MEKQTNFHIGGALVVEQLSPVSLGKDCRGFDLNYHEAFDHHVHSVAPHGLTLVLHFHGDLALDAQPPVSQLE